MPNHLVDSYDVWRTNPPSNEILASLPISEKVHELHAAPTTSTRPLATSSLSRPHLLTAQATAMGLAGPRKRLKIAHDPRNLAWSTSAPNLSVGHKLMTSQGWSDGQALGARTSTSGASTPSTADDDATRLAMSRVGSIFKDDTLGLGAKLKSKDVEGQKTGLDAFQGLLGRLNSKNEEELEIFEKKEGERKLEVYARGRWGGMVFVPGGVLVQGEKFKTSEEGIEEKRLEMEMKKAQKSEESEPTKEAAAVDEKADRKRRKEERRKRKEDGRARKAARSTAATTSKSNNVSAPDEATSSSDEDLKKLDIPAETMAPSPARIQGLPRNGRQILRGRNIEAKRKAFSDTKGLDAIFMK